MFELNILMFSIKTKFCNKFIDLNMFKGMLMQMMFNQNNEVGAPPKSDDIDNSSSSPWANIISVGLRIITALLGGNNNDGIDKIDGGQAGPMQVFLINLFFNPSIQNVAL